MESDSLPYDFARRRLMSFAGLWISFYLIFHLLTNSQAALLFGEDGKGYIHDVNWIHSLPYLNVIEITIVALPILVHLWIGFEYLFKAKFNSFGYTGKTCYLPEYPRNHAYTWQRITAWILIIGIFAHVIHMRFYEYPAIAKEGKSTFYMVRLDNDPGLYTLEKRIDYKIYNPEEIQKVVEEASLLKETDDPVLNQAVRQRKEFAAALQEKPLGQNQVIAVADNFGTSSLLMVRDTFKSPLMMMLYTVFVLTACFHAYNGLWTAMIKWGVTLSARAQNLSRKIAYGLMVIIAFLGLAAIYGTYWINLRN